ncbi:restriction endonuclease subunit S [Azospirillum sp. ST 5-10]|uniref:restriction endonuclease subunit S n=1 Tax=unclassified Azospirillum TaxID=2630922 RepID=UPI003F49B749
MCDWRVGKLGDAIAFLDAGVSVNAEDRPHGAGEIGILKTSAINAGAFRPNENKAVLTREKWRVAEPVESDSVLVSRMNTPDLVGESCYVENAHATLFLPDRIWKLRPRDRSKLSMRWLSFVLQSPEYRRYVQVHATGTSGTMKNLPKARLLALPVAYPEPTEQQTIAHILDTLAVAIDKTEAIIAKLKAVKQGLLHDLLTRGIDANGELRPPQAEAPHKYKISPLGWLPTEWEPKLLNELVDPRRPVVYGILMPGPSYPGGVPVVKVKNIVDGIILQNDIMLTNPKIDQEYNRSRLIAGDLLFTIRGTVGRTAFVPNELQNANITQDTARLAVTGTDPRFVHAYLGMPAPISFVATHTLGVAVQGINLRDVRRIPIGVPSIKEAMEIADRIDKHEKRLTYESQTLTKLRLMKSGLMDDLLTGRVRVTPLLEQGICALEESRT